MYYTLTAASPPPLPVPQVTKGVPFLGRKCLLCALSVWRLSAVDVRPFAAVVFVFVSSPPPLHMHSSVRASVHRRQRKEEMLILDACRATPHLDEGGG